MSGYGSNNLGVQQAGAPNTDFASQSLHQSMQRMNLMIDSLSDRVERMEQQVFLQELNHLSLNIERLDAQMERIERRYNIEPVHESEALLELRRYNASIRQAEYSEKFIIQNFLSEPIKVVDVATIAPSKEDMVEVKIEQAATHAQEEIVATEHDEEITATKSCAKVINPASTIEESHDKLASGNEEKECTFFASLSHISVHDLASILPSEYVSLSQEFKDVFLQDEKADLNPLEGMEHHIDFILGVPFMLRQTCSARLQQTEEIHSHVEDVMRLLLLSFVMVVFDPGGFVWLHF